MTNLLVVDFDFFFPEPFGSGGDTRDLMLHDWGHSETGAIAVLADFLWAERAAGFIRNGLPLPDVADIDGFWDRFAFGDTAIGWATDSNVCAWDPDRMPGVSNVWLFDAHHDSGYVDDAVDRVLDTGRIVCEDWMLAYHLTGAELHVRYPRWKTEAFKIEPEPAVDLDRDFDQGTDRLPVFDGVFVCRSGAWVPPWTDPTFEQFLASCPVVCDWVDPGPVVRPFDRETADDLADRFTQMLSGTSSV